MRFKLRSLHSSKRNLLIITLILLWNLFSVAADLKPSASFSNSQDFYGFETIHSNSTPEQAQVVIIGDYHGDEDYDGHFIRALEIIEKLADNDDILLLEGFDPVSAVSVIEKIKTMPRYSYLTERLPDDFQIFGWDHSGLVNINFELIDAGKSLSSSQPLQAAQLLEAATFTTVTYRNRLLIERIKHYLDNEPSKRVFVTIGSGHVSEEEFVQFFTDSDFNSIIYKSLIAMRTIAPYAEVTAKNRQKVFSETIAESGGRLTQEKLDMLTLKMVGNVLSKVGLEPLPVPSPYLAKNREEN